MMNRIEKINDNLTLIKTRKYKDINVYLRFSIYYSLKEKASLILLSKLYSLTSIKYPSKSLMSNAKDMLYGIDVVSQCKSRANIISLNIQYSFINPKFLNDITLDDYLSFIKETFFNTIIDEKSVNEAKKIVISSMKRRLDKPVAYASEKVNEILAKQNKEFLSYTASTELIHAIKSINLKDVKDSYKNIINKAQLDMYVCGDINIKQLNKLCFIDFNNRKAVNFKYSKFKYQQIKDITNRKKISQSCLNVLYSCPYTKQSKDFFAWNMGNALLGYFPVSLLFMEVREKLSLCYSIGVIDYKNDGLVKIYTNIDGKNKKTVVDEINKQINRIVNKDYDFNQLEISKSLFANSIQSLYDEQENLVDYLYECKLSKFDYSIEEYSRKIMEVTPDQIAKVFKHYKPLFVYMLKGESNEKAL